MYCKGCGEFIPEGVIYCPKCGKAVDHNEQLENSEIQNMEEQPETKGLIYQETSEEIYHRDEAKEDIFQETEQKQQNQTDQTIGEKKASFSTTSASVDAGYMNFSNIPSDKPKKNSKAPYVAMGILGVILLLAVIILSVSVFTREDMNSYVTHALENTIAELDNYFNENIEQSQDLKQEELSIHITDVSAIDNWGIATASMLEAIGDIRLKLRLNNQLEDNRMKMELEGGFSDMNDIQMDFLFDIKENMFYLGFPELYDQYLAYTTEDMEEDLSLDFDQLMINDSQRMDIMSSLVHAIGDYLIENMDVIRCRETKEVILEENGKINTKEVSLTINKEDFEQFVRGIPDVIFSNEEVVSWLNILYTESEIDEFENETRLELENFTYQDEDVIDILLGYVYINNKKQIVQFRIPFDNEDSGQKGDIIYSLLGKERITDYISFYQKVEKDDIELLIDLRNNQLDNQFDINFAMTEEGYLSVKLAASGTTKSGEDFMEIDCPNFEISWGSGYYGFQVNGALNYIKTTADEIVIPETDIIYSDEMTIEEGEKMTATILKNMLDKNYVPSLYRIYVQEILDEYYSDINK